MVVSVTGGISLVLGGLWAEDAGAEVCGSRPVRTIGGCRSVEIAVEETRLSMFSRLTLAQGSYHSD